MTIFLYILEGMFAYTLTALVIFGWLTYKDPMDERINYLLSWVWPITFSLAVLFWLVKPFSFAFTSVQIWAQEKRKQRDHFLSLSPEEQSRYKLQKKLKNNFK